MLDKDTVNQAVEVIRKRVDQFGVSEPVITPQGTGPHPGPDPGPGRSEDQRGARAIAESRPARVPPRAARTAQQIIRADRCRRTRRSRPATRSRRTEKTGAGRQDDGHGPVPGEKDRGHERRACHRRPRLFTRPNTASRCSLDSVGTEQFGDLTKQSYEQQTQLAILLDGESYARPWRGKADLRRQRGDHRATIDETRRATWPAYCKTRCGRRSTSRKSAASRRRSGLDSIKSGVFAGLGGLAARAALRDRLLPVCRARRGAGTGGEHHPALRHHVHVQLRAHAAGHRGHHPDHRPGRGCKRADLRAAARGNGRRQTAGRRRSTPPTTRRSPSSSTRTRRR